MKIMIEFYSTRQQNATHAVLDRVACEATDVAQAVQIARSLLQDLDMPERPDTIMILDACGRMLFSGALDAALANPKRSTRNDPTLH